MNRVVRKLSTLRSMSFSKVVEEELSISETRAYNILTGFLSPAMNTGAEGHQSRGTRQMSFLGIERRERPVYFRAGAVRRKGDRVQQLFRRR